MHPKIYFAPMEGVTDALYRQAHHACFTDVDKYFMPFVSPTPSLTFLVREKFEFSPAQNANLPVVPQILARDSALFLRCVQMFADLGYKEINLNLGCPVGTVTGKGKGSGMLRDTAVLRVFLDEIFSKSTLPISVKTRIGFESAEEWPALAQIFQQYPISELIVHPRTRQEFYKGSVHREILPTFCQFPFPVVYNGDLFFPEDLQMLQTHLPGANAVMLGRGLVANPALARQMHGGEALRIDDIVRFHDKLYRSYLTNWPESAVVGRMHQTMKFLCSCFENSHRYQKAILKSTTAADYENAVHALFESCALKVRPGFCET